VTLPQGDVICIWPFSRCLSVLICEILQHQQFFMSIMYLIKINLFLNYWWHKKPVQANFEWKYYSILMVQMSKLFISKLMQLANTCKSVLIPGLNYTNLFALKFYARRSQKRKKTFFFALLGSTRMKAVRKTLMK